VIEAGEDRRSIKPLIYKFETDFLYYPLKITATSDVGESTSRVNLFLLLKGTVDKAVVENVNLWPGDGFRYRIKLSEGELREVSPTIAELFGSAYAMRAFYYGSLNRLDKDLTIHQQDVYIPTFWDETFQTVSMLPVCLFVSAVYEDILSGYTPIEVKAFLTIILLSFMVGIPSVVVVAAESIRDLLRKHKVKRFGYHLLSYVVSMMAFIPLLSSAIWVALPAIIVFVMMGFSVIVFLMIKLLKRYAS
jgi:hypothetical protein